MSRLHGEEVYRESVIGPWARTRTTHPGLKEILLREGVASGLTASLPVRAVAHPHEAMLRHDDPRCRRQCRRTDLSEHDTDEEGQDECQRVESLLPYQLLEGASGLRCPQVPWPNTVPSA